MMDMPTVAAPALARQFRTAAATGLRMDTATATTSEIVAKTTVIDIILEIGMMSTLVVSEIVSEIVSGNVSATDMGTAILGGGHIPQSPAPQEPM